MKTVLVAIFVFICSLVSAQNLINNYSFEENDTCPLISWAAVSLYPPNFWYQSLPTTTDYWHTCNGSVPKYGFSFFQQPVNGSAYVGIITYYVQHYSIYDYRESISCRINLNLIKNKHYCGSFYTNLAELSVYSIESMGMLLNSDSMLYLPGDTLSFNFLPQIENKSGNLNDSLNWIKIEGSFMADGTEKYVHIGNFRAKNTYGPPQLTNFYNVFQPDSIAYYFIDDVSLYELNKLPQAQNHAYNCAAQTVTLKTDTGFNFRWYYLPDTVNVLSTTDTFMVDASQERTVLLRATLCSTEFADTVTVPKLDCTGLEGNALAQGANLFPNPASTHATLQLGGTPPPGSHLRLLDLHGRELRSMAILTQNTEVPLYSLPAGVYVAELVVNGQGIWRRKLCKFEE